MARRVVADRGGPLNLKQMFFSKVRRFGLTLLAIALVSALNVEESGTTSLSRATGSNRPSSGDIAANNNLPLVAELKNPPQELTSKYPSGSPNDNQIAAGKAFSEAEQLIKDQRAESSRAAIEKFKESLPMWRVAGNRAQEALTLKRIGDVYQPLGEYQNALTFYNQARSLNQAAGDRKSEGETLNDIGYVYLNLGENQRALVSINRALELSQATNNQRGIARALNNLGEIYYGLGKLQDSLGYFDKALRLWRDLNDPAGQALGLLNSGISYSDLGQVREAFSLYQQAISLWESTHDRRGEAITLTAIGRLYSRIGESQEALDFFQRAWDLIEPIGDLVWEAGVLNGMAYIYDGLGESKRALEYYDRSLVLFRTAQQRSGEATTLGEIGRVYFASGDNTKALQHHELALSIFKTIGDRRMVIAELKELGKIHDAKGDKQKALGYYELARTSYRNEKDRRGEAVTLNLAGRIYAGWGRKPTAMKCFTQALLLSQKAEYPIGEATALNNLARLERDSGNLIAARERSEEALRITEALREKVNSPDLRTSYFASVRQQHEFYIDLLMQMHRDRPAEGFDVAAFDASERARARSLLETLTLARIGVRGQTDPALLERERKLNAQFSELAKRRTNSAAKDSAGATALAKETDELVWQLREVEAQIRASSTSHMMVQPTRPLDLRSIQQRVLDDDSVLLEYVLGEERSYLWAVTRTEVSSYELPARAQIEVAARQFRELLTANQARANETFQQQQARIREADAQLPAAAAALSELLIAPVQTRLGTKRLLIVPDGVLQFIPFQALTVPSAIAGERIPLLIDHEIVYEPSASALALVLQDRPPRDTGKTVAVFADPVFEPDDQRVRAGGNTNSSRPPASDAPGAFRDLELSDERVRSLPASREEAEAILSRVPWGTGLKALGFDASRAAVTKPELSQYPIVHFATHGVVNYEHPELSGLILSLVDQNGRPQEGHLRLHDIYNLKLSANLVVLSACDTGLGKEIKGEGLISLTRAFMYAGSSSVAASLWKVDDDSTAELMKYFYRGMFRDGLTPAAALRQAQIEMWQHKRWHAPYHWAAFVIQGRYDQTEKFAPSTSRAQTLVTASGLFSGLLLAACLFFRRRRTRIV